ncbi:WXG100 family type VII secretion target [Psychromicrobium lacuslunae]|uniref:WXG100 family type VII secretion target n=1 Tax=Psychromicrobium lacuslunae TaxID=1618207 RepID=A0A0D4C2R3_9MICC|nr:hypothetical protein [Psychromicrobium lacuslunae]AJT40473.1 hypothetical protein UM93_00965 [Psychromicrobium lacuslunae]AJT42675.1 hypothetical protein UM93_16530 [Psychromicrobium lacuslunae]
MGEAFLGSNPEDMQDLITKINQAVDQIHQAVNGLDSKATSVQWNGPDANNFKHTEWPQHKQNLNKVADDLHQVGQTVQKQRQQQIDTSGH